MASTTTYGDFPGVKVATAGGAITGVSVGREQILVLVGNGYPDDGTDPSGSADANEAVQLQSRLDADRKFGEGTELAEQMKDALANGANQDFLWGVMTEEISVTGESLGGVSGTLANAPIVEEDDPNASGSLLTITGDVSGEYTIEYRYDSPPTNGGTVGTAYVNPITGEVEVEDDGDATYTVDYTYPDVASARNEATTVFGDEETGFIAHLHENGDLATDLSGTVNTLRGEYKLAMGIQAAEPNANLSDAEAPDYDTGSYADNIDNDAMFLHAPARKEGSQTTITGALAGYMAGRPLGTGGSVYGDILTVDDIGDRLAKSEADDLRSKQVMPIRQPPSGGGIRIEDNLSTSTDTDWVRDYWRRRIVDQAILIAKSVGDSIIGRINDQRTRDTVENTIKSELKGLATDRLITTNYFVEVYQIDSDTVGIDLGVTPQGIVKRVDVSITINT